MEKTRIQIEKYYNSVVAEDLLILYNSRNIMQLPQMQRIVFSTSSKHFLLDKQEVLNQFLACSLLTGQKALATRARKSVAAFGLREGNMIGCVVTLRERKMYAFLHKICTVVLARLQQQSTQDSMSNPKLRSSFVKRKSFVEQRDFHFGIKDATLFPEMEKLFDTLSHVHGFNISFSFSNSLHSSRLEGKRSLTLQKRLKDIEEQVEKSEKLSRKTLSYNPANFLYPKNEMDNGGKVFARAHKKLCVIQNFAKFDKNSKKVQKDLLFLSAFQYPVSAFPESL